MFSLVDVFEMIRVVSINFTIGILQPIYLGVVFFIYILYKRIANLEYNILSRIKANPVEILFESTMYGILAGFIVSMLVNLFGIYIYINNNNLIFLWIIVFILGFINIRYLCFSYAGGILALLNLFTGWPSIDVSGLLALVGLLHLCEAFLIWGQGSKNMLPIFVKHKNKVVGAFSVQKFWPIPIALLVASIITSANMPTDVININTPEWWPLMKQPEVTGNQSLLFSILAIPAVLGYSEVMITERPKNKVRKSATFLSIYSIIVIALAVLSTHIYIIKYVAAIFAIIAHELLILYWIRKEKQGEAFFSVPEKGVRILDVIQGGPAEQMGILPGDIIVRVNGRNVMTHQGIQVLLDDYPSYIWLDVLRDNENTVTLEYQNYRNKINDLQMLIVPRDENVSNIMRISGGISPIQKIFKK